MEKIVLLAALMLSPLAGRCETDLTGCWIEQVPKEIAYMRGMCLNDDGSAESIGMATLRYCYWRTEGDRLILDGESIGNGQTINFSDTLRIIDVAKDTLTLERRMNKVVYVRKSAINEPIKGRRVQRTAHAGFEWRELKGAGMKLRVQRNDKIRLMADPLLPGIVMVRDGDGRPHRLIQVFSINGNDINGVIDAIEKAGEWDKEQPGKFKQVKSGREGVKRYVMVPDGDYAKATDELMKTEPVASTCNGWGVGNSGSRYFEMYDGHPSKVVFVEIGQDAPLFDENSVTLCDEPDSTLSRDVLYTMKGEMSLAHEVRSFRPDGTDDEYWIVDKTGRLEDMYDKITGGQKNGNPVDVTLRLEYNGKWDTGFAEDYDGVFFVREIVEIK
jgi:hypothetical protein